MQRYDPTADDHSELELSENKEAPGMHNNGTTLQSQRLTCISLDEYDDFDPRPQAKRPRKKLERQPATKTKATTATNEKPAAKKAAVKPAVVTAVSEQEPLVEIKAPWAAVVQSTESKSFSLLQQLRSDADSEKPRGGDFSFNFGAASASSSNGKSWGAAADTANASAAQQRTNNRKGSAASSFARSAGEDEEDDVDEGIGDDSFADLSAAAASFFSGGTRVAEKRTRSTMPWSAKRRKLKQDYKSQVKSARKAGTAQLKSRRR